MEGITNDDTKFHCVVAALDVGISFYVWCLIGTSHNINAYETSKYRNTYQFSDRKSSIEDTWVIKTHLYYGTK